MIITSILIFGLLWFLLKNDCNYFFVNNQFNFVDFSHLVEILIDVKNLKRPFNREDLFISYKFNKNVSSSRVFYFYDGSSCVVAYPYFLEV